VLNLLVVMITQEAFRSLTSRSRSFAQDRLDSVTFRDPAAAARRCAPSIADSFRVRLRIAKQFAMLSGRAQKNAPKRVFNVWCLGICARDRLDSVTFRDPAAAARRCAPSIADSFRVPRANAAGHSLLGTKTKKPPLSGAASLFWCPGICARDRLDSVTFGDPAAAARRFAPSIADSFTRFRLHAKPAHAALRPAAGAAKSRSRSLARMPQGIRS
jgi:hypothetical protein